MGKVVDARLTERKKEQYMSAISAPSSKITLSARELKGLATKVGNELSAVERWSKPFSPDTNASTFNLLCLYFSGDSRMLQSGIHPDKGLCLRGPVGCGKSVPMRILSYSPNFALEGQCINPVANFQFISTEQIRTLCDNGTSPNIYANLRQASANFKHLTSQNYIGWCIDDVGSEDMGKYKKSYIANILDEIERSQKGNYHYFHITTNLDDEKFAAAYGDRLLSRLYQMFNVIDFPSDAPDLRRASVNLGGEIQL